MYYADICSTGEKNLKLLKTLMKFKMLVTSTLTTFSSTHLPKRSSPKEMWVRETAARHLSFSWSPHRYRITGLALKSDQQCPLLFVLFPGEYAKSHQREWEHFIFS